MGQASAFAFSKEELRDLITFQSGVERDTRGLLRCECGEDGPQGLEMGEEDGGSEVRSCQLGVQPEKIEEERTTWMS